MTDLLTDTTEGVRRDHYGRPYILLPDGTGEKPYTRATTVAETLSDRYSLEKWMQRQVVLGISRRADLVTLASTLTAADRDALNKIVTEAHDEAKSSEKADLGTELHKVTEEIDAGLDVDYDPRWRQHVRSYRRATEGWEHLHIEQMVLHDTPTRIAGTPDRISILPKAFYGRKKVRPVIADLKTGDSISWSIREIAAQLAIYARSQWMYDWETRDRIPMPEDLDLTTGVIIHLPQGGGGVCKLYRVDLEAEWRAVQLALQVREWRTRKQAHLAEIIDYGDPLDEWLRRRILVCLATPSAQPYLHLLSDPSYGTLKDGLRLDAADQIVAALDRIETQCEISFPERDPRTPTTKPRKR